MIVIHLQKLINTFYKKHPKKLVASFLFLESVLLMARLIVLKKSKQKHDRPNKKANKRDKS